MIAQYESALEAERITGIDHRKISLVASGKRKSSGGYQWKYA